MSSAVYDKNIRYNISRIYVYNFKDLDFKNPMYEELVNKFLYDNDVKNYCFCKTSLSSDIYILFTSMIEHGYSDINKFMEINDYPSLNILDDPNGSCQIM